MELRYCITYEVDRAYKMVKGLSPNDLEESLKYIVREFTKYDLEGMARVNHTTFWNK